MPVDHGAAPAAALMIVRGDTGPPSLAEAARQLNATTDAIDATFGVVPIDPAKGLYSVRVDAARFAGHSDPQQGPFADPPIGPLKPD